MEDQLKMKIERMLLKSNFNDFQQIFEMYDFNQSKFITPMLFLGI